MTAAPRVIRPILLNAQGQPIQSRRPSAYLRAMAMWGGLGGLPGGYAGARGSRELKDWSTTYGSPDADILGDLPTLRSRSRDLCRNGGIAAGAQKTYTTGVVGTGIRPQPQIDAELLGISEEAAKVWNSRTKKLFLAWARSRNADLARRSSFTDMLTTIVSNEFENGDVFIVRRLKERPGEPFWLRLQLIEADRVCNPDFLADTDRLSGGIAFDEDGAPVAVHVLNRHPGDWNAMGAFSWSTVQAFGAETGQPMILQHWFQGRPGQTRGVPRVAPVILLLKQLTRYTEAEIMAAVIGAMFTVFIENPEITDDEAGTGLAPADATDAATPPEYKLGNGSIVDLMGGAKPHFADPNRPNGQFDAFVTSILRQIGVALEIPYEMLIKSFTASYSASKGSMLEAWRGFYTHRERAVRQVCQPVYEWFLDECVARGLVEAAGYFEDPFARAAWQNCSWTGDAMGTIDELKDVLAAKERINLTVSSLAIETPQLVGEEWDKVFEHRQREIKLLVDAGLVGEQVGERVIVEPKEPTPAPEAPPARDRLPDEDDDSEEAEAKRFARAGLPKQLAREVARV